MRILVAAAVAGGWALADVPAAFGQRRPSLGAKVKKVEPKKPAEEVPEQYKDVPAALRFKVRDIDGKDVELKQFLGDVIIVVNTASECGFTPQYEELEALYKKYKDQGLVVLAFPSNDFNQEPHDNAKIKQFCTEKYKVTFPLFEKVQVKDPESACDFYKFLTDKKKNAHYGGPIKWNFTKFIIDRKGEVRGRYESSDKPSGKKMMAKVEGLLKAPRPKHAEQDSDASKADDAKPHDGD